MENLPLLDQSFPQPAGATTKLLDGARRIGRGYGGSYPHIWEPTTDIAPKLFAFAIDQAARLENKPRLRDTPWFWISCLLFCSGCTIVALGRGGEFIALWIVNTISWGLCLWATGSTTTRKQNAYIQRQELLKRAIYDSAAQRIEERRNEARDYNPSVRAASGGGFVPKAPAPPPQPYGVSHEGAEHLVAEWMRYMGAIDVRVTQLSGDGGIDVSGLNYIAQVKNYVGSVDVAAIRELAGVAYADGRKPLFFTSGNYSSGAIAFADQVGIALFVYDAVAGSLLPVSSLASRIMTHGL